MNCGDDDLSPPYISSHTFNGPYHSSSASSVSSSLASVWSDASSQSSDDSSVTSASGLSESDTSGSYCYSSQPYEVPQVVDGEEAPTAILWPKASQPSVALDQRQHPRRTRGCHGSVPQSGSPPSLIRQCDRKVSFVDSLVDSSAQIVEAIWPLSSIPCRTDAGTKGVLPLRIFIQETLRRSRTSYSTLQVALYYLILIKPHVPRTDFTMEQGEDSHSFRALQCGRRMFLSALILASKYLQDRNYSARAWSKISGLNTQEINQNEISFLLAVNWRLHITNELFQRWAGIVLKYTPPSPPSPGSPASLEHEIRSAEWKSIILGLNVELDNVEDIQILSASSAVLSNMSRLAEPVITRTYTSSPRSPRSTPAPAYATPHYLEPCPSTVYCVSKAAPAYGLLPTPKLTPRCVGFRTPAAIPSSYYPGSAMAFAQSQACHAPFTEKWVTSSPRTFNGCRRSSLTNSTSTTSSPESMISDTSSRSSRSSSVSSASSAMSAPPYKLDVLARCRSAQQYVDAGLKDHNGFVSNRGFDGSRSTSPETEFPSSAKEIWTSHDSLTPLAITECNSCVDEVDVDAARTLQELQSSARFSRGAKRSRPKSIDNSAVSQARCIMQDDSQGWSDIVIRSANAPGTNAVSRAKDGRKRACCVAELCRNSLQTPTTSHVRYWK